MQGFLSWHWCQVDCDFSNPPVSESRLRGKIRRIRDALEADPVDVQTLKQLAISGDGLITVDLRSKVWTKLLNVNAIEASRNHEKKEGKVYLMIHCKQIYCSSPTSATVLAPKIAGKVKLCLAAKCQAVMFFRMKMMWTVEIQIWMKIWSSQ